MCLRTSQFLPQLLKLTIQVVSVSCYGRIPIWGVTQARSYDFCSYPFGLFSSTIISQLNPSNTVLRNIALGTLIK
jgi:hypothetical protein